MYIASSTKILNHPNIQKKRVFSYPSWVRYLKKGCHFDKNTIWGQYAEFCNDSGGEKGGGKILTKPMPH